MSRLNFATAETQKTGYIITLCKSVAVSMVITFIAMLLLAALVTYGPVGEDSVELCVAAAVMLSIFIASVVSSGKRRSKGWLTGIITALIYMALMLVLGAVAFGGFSFGSETAKVLLMGILSGSIGGIVGVNINRKKKRK